MLTPTPVMGDPTKAVATVCIDKLPAHLKIPADTMAPGAHRWHGSLQTFSNNALGDQKAQQSSDPSDGMTATGTMLLN